MIRPENITETDAAEITGHGSPKIRDLIRRVAADDESAVRVQLCFVGLEPENYVNYAEAVKIMGYDFGRYDRQGQGIKR